MTPTSDHQKKALEGGTRRHWAIPRFPLSSDGSTVAEARAMLARDHIPHASAGVGDSNRAPYTEATA
jgi:hypothetical protein